jgi:predicted TIM-barrel fold metal-dependent hydrolase
MIIDCHVHAIAATPGHGKVSDYLLRQWNIRFLRWWMRIPSRDRETLEKRAEARLLETINSTDGLDAAVVLAFDAVYDHDGKHDDASTHFYVSNDYVAELASRHPKVLFGASIHPYRKDAVAELERCVQRGAVLLKWLPVVQNFNPADGRCFPF